jgi:geranyl diphosphate 2-C-methyltransferase
MGYESRLANLLGALALGVHDRLAEATQAPAGRSGVTAAALAMVDQYPGSTVEELRRCLGISQPATVRTVDALQIRGLLVREPGADRRSLALRLTAAGKDHACRVLRARADVLLPLVDELDDAHGAGGRPRACPGAVDHHRSARRRDLPAVRHRRLPDNLGRIAPSDRLLDGGSGRGGTSFMANQRFGCRVDGVTISEYQVGFANDQASRRGVDDTVRFHFRNMLDAGFDTGVMQGIWTNETTMYVDLFELYAEFSRLLSFGGRYVCITGCYNDVTGGRSKSVSRIDEHYTCNIHPRSAYFKAMAANGLVPINVIDLTAQTIPYWELRAKSSVATGIEEPFLTAYREGSFHYLLIAADRV